LNDGVRVPASLDFRLLFEASPDILLVLLPDAPRFTMVGATEARLAATHTTRETMGRGLFEQFPDNPDDPSATGTSQLRASLMRVLSTRRADTMAVQKYDIRGPDGTFQSKYWSPKNIPVLSPNGDIAYILHRVEDVTDLIQASELGQELRDRTQQMEREVVARSRELAQANQSLRDANARLGDLDAAKTVFFSSVSHEFRTPLTLLLGPLESALARRPLALSPEEVSSMHRNALRLLRLVNSLLDFSRIEAGGLRLRFAPTDLSRLTAGLAASFQSLMDESGLRFVVDCPEMPELLYVDRTQWEKVVLNLLSNAFKFTFSGEIRVSLEWHGDHVRLLVRDTGTGIPPGELERIFERFHRVSGAKGRSFEGTGIGLALVHDLARLHGGSVTVHSNVGEGSTFTVSLPTGSAHLAREDLVPADEGETADLAPNQQLEARQWLTPEAAVGATGLAGGTATLAERDRILVVDDNADMRAYLAGLLARHWDVETATDGADALAAARRQAPDLVLSDVMMPVMDGVALLAELRSNPATSTIPVILLSARAGEEARLEGIETGADDYLVKPFAARELFARVSTHLSMARVRRAAEETARELADTRAKLIHELEQTNRNLLASYNQLAETQPQLVHAAKMASLGELVAGIAHEINNPLAFVKSHVATVQNILSGVESKLDPELLALLGSEDWRKAVVRLADAERGLIRIQDLIVKLRSFSRLDEGQRKVASIRECIESTVSILRHRLDEEIRIVHRLEAPDLVDCYPGLLNQALLNLVSNALDAIAGNGEVTIATSVRQGNFELMVSDTGPGIPAALRDRVLEPFFTTKPVGQGTGLGLSIAYSIAKKHDGELTVGSAPGGGAEVTLAFPLLELELAQ